MTGDTPPAGPRYDRWQAAVPCRDALDRDKAVTLIVRSPFRVVAQVPPGETLALTGGQAADLAELLAAAAGQVPEQPSRSVVVTDDFTVARTRADWLASCVACEANGEDPDTQFPTRDSYRRAEQDAVQHCASAHGQPDPN